MQHVRERHLGRLERDPRLRGGYPDGGLHERLALSQPPGRRLVGAVTVTGVGAPAEQQVAVADKQQVNIDDELEMTRASGRLGGQRLHEGFGHDVMSCPTCHRVSPVPAGRLTPAALTLPLPLPRDE